MGRWPKQKSDRPSQNPFGLVFSIYNRQRDLTLHKGPARALVGAVLNFLGVPFEEVSIYFVGAKRIAQLHGQFFDDPTPTDCISFPIDKHHLGEVFICPKVAIDYVAKKGGEAHREVALYVIHALLHLIGYDDLKPQAKAMMRKKEKSCMRHLDRLKLVLS